MPETTREGGARFAVVVLGMHRSGTSALSGLLAHMGCTTPLTQIEVSQQNARGFFESRRVARLNDRILKASRSTWHDWRPLTFYEPDSQQGVEFRDAAAGLIEEEFNAAELIVLKDPRICRLVPIWIDALTTQGYEPLLVHTHRSPFEVAQSLRIRNGFPSTLGVLLWLRHVLDAEHFTRGLRRAFVSYDNVLADWRAVVGTLSNRLNMAFPVTVEAVGSVVDEFLSVDLRNVAAAAGNRTHPILLEYTRICFDVMQRWACSGEDRRDYDALDRVRAELTNTSWTFVNVVDVGAFETKKLRSALSTAQALIAEEVETRSVVERKLAEALARNHDLSDHCDRQSRELSVLTSRLLELEQRNTKAQDPCACGARNRCD